MKYLIAIIVSLFLIPMAALAVEPFYGCAVEPIPGTNAFQFVDAACPPDSGPNYVEVDVIDPETGKVIGTVEVSVDNK